jgi:regulator of protease activity HflC (stomatin/prohibitin superfamily)
MKHDFSDPPFERQFSEQFERAGDWLKRSLPKIAPIAVVVVTLLWLASGIYMVGPGHVGVVRTFGKETARTEPGLNYRFPWPIQRADVVSVEQTMLFLLLKDRKAGSVGMPTGGAQ